VLSALRGHGTQALDGKRRQRSDLTMSSNLRLLHRLDRVMPDPPPLDGSPQDALEKRKRAVDRRLPHLVGFEFRAEALNNLRRNRVQSHRAQTR